MAGQFTVVVAVVALRHDWDWVLHDPPPISNRPLAYLVAPRCVWSTKPGTKPTPAYRVRWFYKTPPRW
jgi:hypothetical protein